MAGYFRTSMLERAGFANRTLLANNINSRLATIQGQRPILIDNLQRTGLLKSHVSPDQLQIAPDNISGIVTRRWLAQNHPDLLSEELFENSARIIPQEGRIASILNRANAAPRWLSAKVHSTWGAASLGTLLYGLYDSGSWAGLTAASLTTGAVGLYKATKHLDPNSKVRELILKTDKLLLPITMAGSFLWATGMMYMSDSSFGDVLNSMGGITTLGLSSGLLWLINNAVRKNKEGLENSFGSYPLPGNKEFLKKRIAASTYSVFASVNFITALAILFAANSANNIVNSAQDYGVLYTSTFAAPFIGMAAKFMLLNYADKYGKVWDFFKKYSTLVGIGAGFVLSTAIASMNTGHLELAHLWPYITFFGTAWTLFSQGHGVFSEINTALADQAKVRYPNVDPMGQAEARGLVAGLQLLGENASMGPKENAYGMIANTILNNHNYYPIENCNDLLPHRNETHARDYTFIQQHLRWIRELQRGIYAIATRGILGPATLEDRYATLETNLRDLASHYEVTLQDNIRERVNRFNGLVFADNDDNTDAFVRALYEAITIRAQTFRDAADRLHSKREAGAISYNDFEREFNSIVMPFDWDYNPRFSIPRKAIEGDDCFVRKGENINGMSFQRGMTTYKTWRKESPSQPYPIENYTAGTWTCVPNPQFSYFAEPGTLEASKFIWLRREEVLTRQQRENQEFLSTSRWLYSIDNTPAEEEGFVRGTDPIPLCLNDRDITLNPGDYFFSGTQEHAVPTPKSFVFRPSATRASVEAIFGTTNRDQWEQFFINPQNDVLVFAPGAREKIHDSNLPDAQSSALTALLNKPSAISSLPNEVNCQYLVNMDVLVNNLGYSKREAVLIMDSLQNQGYITAQGIATEKGKSADESEIQRSLPNISKAQRIRISLLLHGQIHKEYPNAPFALTMPLWRYSDMLDRNVAKTDNTTLPALLQRKVGERSIQLIWQERSPALPWKNSVTFDNPFPDKVVDATIPIDIIDTNLAISRRGIEVPFMSERAVLPNWAGISTQFKKAQAHISNGEITSFSLAGSTRAYITISDLEPLVGNEAKKLFGKMVDEGLLVKNGINDDYGIITKQAHNFISKKTFRESALDRVLIKLGQRLTGIKPSMTIAGTPSGKLTPFNGEKAVVQIKGMIGSCIGRAEKSGTEERKFSYSFESTSFPEFLPILVQDEIEQTRTHGSTETVDLDLYTFMDSPGTPIGAEGMVSFARITYTDGSFAFARLPYNNRPFVFNPNKLNTEPSEGGV